MARCTNKSTRPFLAVRYPCQPLRGSRLLRSEKINGVVSQKRQRPNENMRTTCRKHVARFMLSKVGNLPSPMLRMLFRRLSRLLAIVLSTGFLYYGAAGALLKCLHEDAPSGASFYRQNSEGPCNFLKSGHGRTSIECKTGYLTESLGLSAAQVRLAQRGENVFHLDAPGHVLLAAPRQSDRFLRLLFERPGTLLGPIRSYLPLFVLRI